MKEWKEPKLSNLEVSQTMTTREGIDPQYVLWYCDCGCGATSSEQIPNDDHEGRAQELQSAHMPSCPNATKVNGVYVCNIS